MIVLGVSGGFGHDASASLLVDGELLAFVEEERLSRSKAAVGRTPALSIVAACSVAGVKLSDVDALALAWDPRRDASLTVMQTVADAVRSDPLLRALRPSQIREVPHHLAHAETARFFAHDDPAGVLVVDGRGEDSSASIFRVDGADLRLVYQLDVVDSLGSFYSAAARFSGFGRGGEGKLMGLGAYASPGEWSSSPRAFEIHDGPPMAIIDVQRSNVDHTLRHAPVRSKWLKFFESHFGKPATRSTSSNRMTLLEETDPTADLKFSTFAHWAQQELENAMRGLWGLATELCGSSNLLISGGVGLNCSLNGALRHLTERQDFVHALTGDSGAAIGAASSMARSLGDIPRRVSHAYLGPSWDDSAVVAALVSCGITFTEPVSIADEIAERIAAGEVVGWFQGAAEAGPRALGHRSLLADPRRTSTRDLVNRIKGREPWRPLAPSLRPSDAVRFCGGHNYPFMLEAVQAGQQAREDLAAVVHADGSSRPHTTSAFTDPRFVQLLDALSGTIGWGAVMNTSFNIGAEPIVYAPLDALRSFFGSSINTLAIGPAMVSKS